MTDAAHEYAVLVNQAGQYALHQSWAAAPDGWRADGFVGPEEACIAYVDEHWNVIRPQHVHDTAGG